MRACGTITTAAIAILLVAAATHGADAGRSELQQRFRDAVRPFVETYCLECHGKEKPKGDFDLSAYTSLDRVAGDDRQWAKVLEKLKAGEMPPDDAKRQPSADKRQRVVSWITDFRDFSVRQGAGDPGIVLARRLSNAEYNYTIRDLTGVDIQPANEFPVDPANQAGFDNSGESLAMSPFLLKKYMEAARQVSEHLVLRLDGLAFAPHPVIAETDRDKYCVNRIIQFYQRQPTDLAMYLLAAWRYENRATLGRPQASLSDFATEEKVSAKYLANDLGCLVERRADRADRGRAGDVEKPAAA